MRARDNPFRSERILALRYRLSEDGWNDLLSRLESLKRRAAIVGPKGSGKTTLLEDLAPRLAARGWTPRPLRLDEEHPKFDGRFLEDFVASLGPRDVILFDGAEQLGFLDWRRFERRTRSAGGLILTLHRPGRLPTLLETRTSPELLDALVAQLLGPEDREQGPASRELYARHAGNLREALREFYDRFARA